MGRRRRSYAFYDRKACSHLYVCSFPSGVQCSFPSNVGQPSGENNLQRPFGSERSSVLSRDFEKRPDDRTQTLVADCGQNSTLMGQIRVRCFFRVLRAQNIPQTAQKPDGILRGGPTSRLDRFPKSRFFVQNRVCPTRDATGSTTSRGVPRRDRRRK